MLNNIEKYNQIHNTIMKRLTDGEITIEMAKEVNDLAFNKYIAESGATTNSTLSNDEKQKLKAKHAELKKEYEQYQTEYRKLNTDDGTQEEFKKMIELEARMKKINREMRKIEDQISGHKDYTWHPKDD